MRKTGFVLLVLAVAGVAIATSAYVRSQQKPDVLPWVGRGFTYSGHHADWYWEGDKNLQPKIRITPEQNLAMYFVQEDAIKIDRQTKKVTINRVPGSKPNFDWFRLACAWNLLEPEARKDRSGLEKYDFSDHDDDIRLAQEHPVNILLVTGLKGVYYPEHYFPEQHDPGGSEDSEREIKPGSPAAKALLQFVKVMVNRYKNGFRDSSRGIAIKPVKDWQIENEPFEKTGAGPTTSISRELLAEEVALVRKLDPEARIWLTMGSGLTDTDIMTTATTRRWQTIADDLCDLKPNFIGMNTYLQGYGVGEWEFKTKEEYWTHVRDSIVKRIQGRGIRVVNVEYQAAPWEDDPSNFDIYNPAGNKSLKPEDIATVARLVDSMGTEGGWPFYREFANVCYVNGNPDWYHAQTLALRKKYWSKPVAR